jgi:hypothetical protein
MVAGLLVVSLPITLALAVVLTSEASNSLTAAGANSGAELAYAVTPNIEAFMSERLENLTEIAELATGRLDDPAVARLATSTDRTYGDYQLIEITDLTGRVVTASRPQGRFNPRSEPWFLAATHGRPVVASLVQDGGGWAGTSRCRYSTKPADHRGWSLANSTSRCCRSCSAPS